LLPTGERPQTSGADKGKRNGKTNPKNGEQAEQAAGTSAAGTSGADSSRRGITAENLFVAKGQCGSVRERGRCLQFVLAGQ